LSVRLRSIRSASLVWATLAVALTAVMLAVFPAAAEAQTQTQDEGARSVVVRPGDSLWSISEELLGPDATPQRIVDGAEQLHALNRARIGADPDLIIVGQELTIPWSMSEPPAVETRPSPKIAEASEANPRDLAATGLAGEEDSGRALAQGAVPRSEISPEEAAKTLEADTKGKEALPDPRAVAPVPAVRMVALNDAQPESIFGVYAGTRAEGRRLLGLLIIMLTPLLAALVAASGRNEGRRGARKRELMFRETYGSCYDASDPLAPHEGASRPVSEVRGHTPPSDGPTNAGVASEELFDRVDLFAAARAKRERIRRRRRPGLRRQPPRLQVHGLRRQGHAQSQRRPFSKRQMVTTRAGHKEWEPSAALVGVLGVLPLRLGTGYGEGLAKIKPHLEESLEALERLERRRRLSEREKTRREALRTLMTSIERVE